MPSARSRIPQPLMHTAFSTREAHRFGITPTQLRGPNYKRVAPRIYCPHHHTPNVWDFARIVSAECPEAVLAQVSAALVWELPIPDRFIHPFSANDQIVPDDGEGHIPDIKSALEVPRFSTTNSTRLTRSSIAMWRCHGVLDEDQILVRPERLEKYPSEHQVRVAPAKDTDVSRTRLRGLSVPPDVIPLWEHSLAVMSLERTFLDLATVLNRYELVAVGDAIVREPRHNLEGRSQPWSSLERLCRVREKYPGIDGSVNVRWALRHIRVGADSPQETMCRLLLVAAGFPEPELNVPIPLSNGDVIPDRDLVFRDRKVVVEYQGAHHGGIEQVRRDDYFASRLRADGWKVVQVFREDIPFVGWCTQYPLRFVGHGISRYQLDRVSFRADPLSLAPTPTTGRWPLIQKVAAAFYTQ